MYNISEGYVQYENDIGVLFEQVSQYRQYGHSMIKEDCMKNLIPLIKNGVDKETKCGSLLQLWGTIVNSMKEYLKKIHRSFSFDDKDPDTIYSIYKFFIIDFSKYLSLAIMSYINSNPDYIYSKYYLSQDANVKVKMDSSINDLKYCCNMNDPRIFVALLNIHAILNEVCMEYNVWDYVDPQMKNTLEHGLNINVWDINTVSFNGIILSAIQLRASNSASFRAAVLSDIYTYILKDKKSEILNNSKFFSLNYSN